jgi:hypothetical protein
MHPHGHGYSCHFDPVMLCGTMGGATFVVFLKEFCREYA